MFKLTKIISKTELAEFCRKYHIEKLFLFGSALRNKLHKGSDIDLLVVFEPGFKPSLMVLAGMEIELSKMIGRKVDLRTPDELSRYFRKEVLSKARIEYAA